MPETATKSCSYYARAIGALIWLHELDYIGARTRLLIEYTDFKDGFKRTIYDVNRGAELFSQVSYRFGDTLFGKPYSAQEEF